MDRTLTEKMLEQVKVIADAAKRIADELEAAPPKGVIAVPGDRLVDENGQRALVITRKMYYRAGGADLSHGHIPCYWDGVGYPQRAPFSYFKSASGKPITGYEDD